MASLHVLFTVILLLTVVLSRPAMAQAHHDKLAEFGRAVAPDIKASVGLHDFSLVLVRDGVAVRKGRPVVAFWLFFRYEGREDTWAGGGKVEGVAVLQLVPQIKDGDWNVEAEASVLSARPAQWGPGGTLADATKRALKKLRDQIRKLDAAEANIARAATELARRTLQSIPASGFIPADPNYIERVCRQLFPLSSGVVVGTGPYGGAQSGQIRDASLIVVLIRQTDCNAILWRRSNDLNGGVMSKEKRSPGHSIHLWAAKKGGSISNLKIFKRADGHWNDELGSVIVIPGPNYSGEHLELYGHAKDDNRWPGGAIWCRPGFYSLVLKKRDVADPNARNHQYLNEAVSSLAVVD